MNKGNNKHTEPYEPPRMEVLEIMVEQAILSASGYGNDTEDYFEFGERYYGW